MQTSELEARIPDLVSRLRSEGFSDVCIYGAGEHTAILLNLLQPYSDIRVTALLVSEERDEQTRFGLPVYGIDSFSEDTCDAVVLSSSCYEREMYITCRDRMPDLNIVPIWDSPDTIQRDWDHDFERHRNLHEGETAWLIGSGPSVRTEDLDRLSGRISFVCNRFHLAYSRTQFRPTYTVSSDPQMVEDFGEEIASRSVGEIFFVMPQRPDLRGDFKWVRNQAGLLTTLDIGRSRGIRSSGGSLIAAIQLGYFMGIRRFALYGVDHRFENVEYSDAETGPNAMGDGNHFIENYRSGKRWWAPEKGLIEKGFAAAAEALALEGGWMRNATRGGELNVIPRFGFNEAIRLE